LCAEIYTEGVADIVGYWVEDDILGGVVVFDRRYETLGAASPNVYLHPCRDRVARRASCNFATNNSEL
jgi:hypothetical protein